MISTRECLNYKHVMVQITAKTYFIDIIAGTIKNLELTIFPSTISTLSHGLFSYYSLSIYPYPDRC